MRKLATVRKISAIEPIIGADAIECATIDGWKVVVKKGEFKINDNAVYIEIDAWVPNALAPFLSKGKEPREFNGVKGEKLRTIKLRGQISQGLLLPCTSWIDNHCEVGDNLTEYLGIQKYEPPITAQLAGLIKGNFPVFLKKTDQERIQNLSQELKDWAQSEATWEAKWEITEKLDGSSMTCYLNNGEFGVCSRNLDLKRDENNSFWECAIKNNIESKMRAIGGNFAIQGELIGQGIQKNPYGLSSRDFYLFDVFNIDSFSYLLPDERYEFHGRMELLHCPVLDISASLFGKEMAGLIESADGDSFLKKVAREGLVFKSNTENISFKVISNKFLLAE